MLSLWCRAAIRSFFVAVPSCSTDALAHPALESYFVGPVFAGVLSVHGEISHFGPSFPENLWVFLLSFAEKASDRFR